MAGYSTKGATVIGAPKGPSAPERMLATQASAMPSCSLLRYVGVGGMGYLAGISSICGGILPDRDRTYRVIFNLSRYDLV